MCNVHTRGCIDWVDLATPAATKKPIKKDAGAGGNVVVLNLVAASDAELVTTAV